MRKGSDIQWFTKLFLNPDFSSLYTYLGYLSYLSLDYRYSKVFYLSKFCATLLFVQEGIFLGMPLGSCSRPAAVLSLYMSSGHILLSEPSWDSSIRSGQAFQWSASLVPSLKLWRHATLPLHFIAVTAYPCHPRDRTLTILHAKTKKT